MCSPSAPSQLNKNPIRNYTILLTQQPWWNWKFSKVDNNNIAHSKQWCHAWENPRVVRFWSWCYFVFLSDLNLERNINNLEHQFFPLLTSLKQSFEFLHSHQRLLCRWGNLIICIRIKPKCLSSSILLTLSFSPSINFFIVFQLIVNFFLFFEKTMMDFTAQVLYEISGGLVAWRLLCMRSFSKNSVAKTTKGFT